MDLGGRDPADGGTRVPSAGRAAQGLEIDRSANSAVVRGGRVKVAATLATHRGACGRRSCRTVTLRCHYYSLTSSWVKTLTVPESPSPGLYNQALVCGISMNATPLTRIVNLQLNGGSTPFVCCCVRPR